MLLETIRNIPRPDPENVDNRGLYRVYNSQQLGQLWCQDPVEAALQLRGGPGERWKPPQRPTEGCADGGRQGRPCQLVGDQLELLLEINVVCMKLVQLLVVEGPMHLLDVACRLGEILLEGVSWRRPYTWRRLGLPEGLITVDELLVVLLEVAVGDLELRKVGVESGLLLLPVSGHHLVQVAGRNLPELRKFQGATT